MSKTIYSILPDHEALLSLAPEELAGIVLEYLHSLDPMDATQKHPGNFGSHHTVREYPREYWNPISKALMEAWVWLEREGLIAPVPGSHQGFVFITRRGERLKNATDLQAYRLGDMLPRRLLHPVIAAKVWATFLRGEYDTAVFQAFKEVEVQVRIAGGFSPRDLGQALMRKAFNADNGPLRDSSAVDSERQGLSDLFAGAIASYKNPHSHRNVTLDATEAVELIMLASHLLKIVDARSGTP